MPVNLPDCREMMNAVAQLKEKILRGEIRGLAICSTDRAGREACYFAGTYSREPARALKASLHMSWELSQRDEMPPSICKPSACK
jgi:hypothetical protein